LLPVESILPAVGLRGDSAGPRDAPVSQILTLAIIEKTIRPHPPGQPEEASVTETVGMLEGMATTRSIRRFRPDPTSQTTCSAPC
jgi:hypothetical protein